ncbi:hypothetical protein PMAYCL1PPCAC_29081, partial [Pristionchus mayeri]
GGGGEVVSCLCLPRGDRLGWRCCSLLILALPLQLVDCHWLLLLHWTSGYLHLLQCRGSPSRPRSEVVFSYSTPLPLLLRILFLLLLFL